MSSYGDMLYLSDVFSYEARAAVKAAVLSALPRIHRNTRKAAKAAYREAITADAAALDAARTVRKLWKEIKVAAAAEDLGRVINAAEDALAACDRVYERRDAAEEAAQRAARRASYKLIREVAPEAGWRHPASGSWVPEWHDLLVNRTSEDCLRGGFGYYGEQWLRGYVGKFPSSFFLHNIYAAATRIRAGGVYVYQEDDGGYTRYPSEWCVVHKEITRAVAALRK